MALVAESHNSSAQPSPPVSVGQPEPAPFSGIMLILELSCAPEGTGAPLLSVLSQSFWSHQLS